MLTHDIYRSYTILTCSPGTSKHLMSNTARSDALNQEKKKKKKERTFRNVFILAHPISLYKSGAAVWSLNDQLFGKTWAGVTRHTHQNRATKLYPR
jgi:hypothetical protein